MIGHSLPELWFVGSSVQVIGHSLPELWFVMLLASFHNCDDCVYDLVACASIVCSCGKGYIE